MRDFFLWALGLALAQASPPLVKLEQGDLLGETWKTYSTEKEFHAFRGVPYAKPPVGELRFRSPEDALGWEGVRSSKEHNDTMCAQMTFQEELAGVEDCLYMNIFTPRDAFDPDRKKPYPVLFWIHGGGFFAGSSGVSIYGPEHFMEHEKVVFVTFNYRVGPLGFITLDDPLMPGNQGLRDQIKALEWVRDNIAKFGGDSGKVTIMGESAGSMAVSYLMVSPKAKGLFHAAIGLSGTFISSYTKWDKHPRLYAERFAHELGCSRPTVVEIVECMQALPALDIPEKLQLFLHFKWTGPNVWMPYVDSTSDDPVLPVHPIDAIKSGKYNNVPVIFGTNSDEGAFNLLGFLLGVIDLEEVENRWPEIGPLMLFSRGLDERSPDDSELAETVKSFYLKDKRISEDTKFELIKLMGDHMFYGGIHRTINLMLDSPNPPPNIYQYMYSHVGSFTTLDAFLLSQNQYLLKIGVKYLTGYNLFDQGLGVAHADALFTLFQPHVLPINSLISDSDKIVSERMTGMFTDFACSHNPTPESGLWKPVTSATHEYLNVTAEPEINMEYRADYWERVQFWKQVQDRHDEIRPYDFLSEKPPVLVQELQGRQKAPRTEL